MPINYRKGKGAAMNRAEMTMRMALDLFVMDPPTTDFQQGYLCALMVFAREGLDFSWDDPSLSPFLKDKTIDEICKSFTVIQGGKS